MKLKDRLNKIKPEYRLPLAIGATAVVVGMGVGGVYLVKNNASSISDTVDNIAQTKEVVTQFIGIKALEASPGAYIDNLSSAIELNPQGFADYGHSLDVLTMTINDSALISGEMREYVFTENAGLVPVEIGLETCKGVYESATPEQQLEVVLAQISGMETSEYGPILKELGAGVFDQVKDFFGGN